MSSLPSRRRATIGAIAIAVLLIVTACSDDSTDGSASQTAAQTTAESTTSESTTAESTAEPANSTPMSAPADPSAPADGGTDTTDASADAVVVPEALQFTAPLVGGGTFDGAAVAGKPTVFWFWAPT